MTSRNPERVSAPPLVRTVAVSALALFLASGWASGSPAAAQDVEVAPVASPPAAPVPAAPVPGGAVDLSTGRGFPPEAAPVPPDDGRIEVGALGAIEPGAVGTLGPGEGAFPADLWRGLDRSGLEEGLAALPAPSGSAAGRELSRRLLLSAADVPPAIPGGRDLVALRADKLIAGGRAADAADLVSRVGAASRAASGLDMRAAEAAFLAGDNEGACTHVDFVVGKGTGPETLKATAFCRALVGDAEGASLAIDMLREDQHEDRAFAALMVSILGGKPAKLDPKTRPWDDPPPLRIAMARAAKLPLPEALYADPPPRLVPALLAMEGPEAGRLAAARRAEALGLIDARTLGQKYAAASFTDAERAGGIAAARTMSGARQAARLHQIVADAPSMDVAAEALGLALSAARADRTFATAARVALPDLRALPPEPARAAMAPLVVRALVAAGDVDRALQWYAMLRAAAPGNSDVAFMVLDLWPLVQIADGGDRLPWGIESPARWLRGQAAAGDRFHRAAIAYTLFQWRGWPVGDAAWAPVREGLTDPGAAASPGLVAMMNDAARKPEPGRALLAALAILGEGPPDRLSPADLGAVLAALEALNLHGDATALAVEAAIGAGL